MSREFASCLDVLKTSEKESYDPWTHPILEEFKEQILAGPYEGEQMCQEDAGGELEDSEVVVGQVTKSFKCPLTRQFYEVPVTNKICNHSYSQVAIREHIKKRCGISHFECS